MPEGEHDPENKTGGYAWVPYRDGECATHALAENSLRTPPVVQNHIPVHKFIPRKIPEKFGNMTLHSLVVLCIIIQNDSLEEATFRIITDFRVMI